MAFKSSDTRNWRAFARSLQVSMTTSSLGLSARRKMWAPWHPSATRAALWASKTAFHFRKFITLCRMNTTFGNVMRSASARASSPDAAMMRPMHCVCALGVPADLLRRATLGRRRVSLGLLLVIGGQHLHDDLIPFYHRAIELDPRQAHRLGTLQTVRDGLIQGPIDRGLGGIGQRRCTLDGDHARPGRC